ncbi:MAG: MIP/aquaporin family protein [Thermomicrobiales bacterium]
MGDRELVKQLIIEFLGPALLVFAGVGAIIQTQGEGADLVAVALAHGLAIGLMVLAAGHISGGHFNPAVTIGFYFARRIETNRAVAYIVAQLAGALVGAGALTLVYQDIDRNRVNLGVPAVGQAFSDAASLGAGRALVMEIILAFFLMFVIFGTAIDVRSGGRAIAGLAMGLTISLDILAGGIVSGAAMNPARWFGPAIVQQEWSDFWVWWVGPIIGAVAAAILYNDILMRDVRATAEPPRRPRDEESPVPAESIPVEPPRRSRRSTRRR